MNSFGQEASAPSSLRPKSWFRLKLALVAALALGFFSAWQWRAFQADAERLTGLELARLGQFELAEPMLLSAFERNAKDIEVVKALALGRFQREPLAEAEPWLNRWVELEPTSSSPLRIRMELRARLFKREEALADGQRLLWLEPNDLAVRKQVGWMQLAVGKLDEARAMIQEGLAKAPSDAELLYLNVEVLQVQGRKEELALQLDTLLNRFPDHQPGLLMKGRLLLEQGHPDQAIAPLRRVAASASNATDRQAARYHLSQALARSGNNEGAEKVLREFRRHLDAERLLNDSEQQQDNWKLHVQAADELAATGQIDKAIRLLTGLVERKPDCLPAHAALARIFESVGERSLAEQHRRAAAPR